MSVDALNATTRPHLRASYAGSHGHDILLSMPSLASDGPAVQDPRSSSSPTTIHYQVGREFLPVLQRAYSSFSSSPLLPEGATVEDNVFNVSIHYRNVAAEDAIHRLRSLVDDYVASAEVKGMLSVRDGKKVWELRPNFHATAKADPTGAAHEDHPSSWNKGRAVQWICEHKLPSLRRLRHVGLAPPPAGPNAGQTILMALGDDLTDEDMFAYLNSLKAGMDTHLGLGSPLVASVLVATPTQEGTAPQEGVEATVEGTMPRPTGADAFLRSPAEVQHFLAQILVRLADSN